jgi:TolB-like protein/Flp pilus assembly protein TadD/predicted Ser/Thr protein kinase
MECPKCHSENPDNSSFCGKCATPLSSLEEISASPTKTLKKASDKLTRGTTFAARYEVIEELGKGGMGKVYRVFDEKIEEEVALKLIQPEISSDKKTIERFRNELKVARKIAHRNVCKMYDLGQEEDSHYITMEYVPGESLKSMIGMMGQLSAGQVVFIAKQVCEGLAEAHRLGVVHRDLKPSNIIIDREGNTHIMDFGIARSLKAKGVTAPGMMIGTPEYMSPEQVDGKEVDQRSDIYSLGVILYEMTTGRLPFEGDTSLSIAIKHKTETPPEPGQYNAQIPEGLSQLILRCMDKDKEKRYQEAKELLSELIKIEEGISTVERVVPARKPTPSKEVTLTLKKPWMMIAALFAVVVVAGIGILYFINKKPASSREQGMLVVLPFGNLGPPEDEYFADGISEEITSRLSALHGLGVISRTSAKLYKKVDKTIQQIGKELGVDYILEGTVRWDRSAGGKGRVRVTPQLVRVSDDTHIWSDSYNRALEDIFSVQSEIAEQVAKKLDIVVLEPERKAIYAKPTYNLEAYDCYLRAREHVSKGWNNLDPEEFEKAVNLYIKALELDPEFTFAYIALSFAHSLAYISGIDRIEERIIKSKQAVDKAIELEPDLPEVKSALGIYYYRARLDYDRALELFESVRKARPNWTSQFIGYIQRRQGKWEESIQTLKNVFKLNPRSYNLAGQLGLTYVFLRRYEEAEKWFDKALSINPDLFQIRLGKAEISLFSKGTTEEIRALLETKPQFNLIGFTWFTVFMYERNYQEALKQLDSLAYDSFYAQDLYFHKDLAYADVYHAMEESSLIKTHADSARVTLEKVIEENPQDPRLHSALGIAYAYLGREEEAIQEGKRAVNLHPISKDAVGGSAYILHLTTIYTIIGEYENAISQLELLLSVPAGSSVTVPLLKVDPIWDPLRKQPRFQRLLQEAQEGERR